LFVSGKRQTLNANNDSNGWVNVTGRTDWREKYLK
jgi:hypothetical protein